MAINKAPLFGAWLLALAGGVVLIGAVAALTSDTPDPYPAVYKLAWTAIAMEVATLLVTLYAIVSGAFGSWKHTVTAMLATVTAILVPITNDVLAAKGGLPGSDGSDIRANTAAAGLIIVMIGNYAIMFASAICGDSAPVPAPAPAIVDLSGVDVKESA